MSKTKSVAIRMSEDRHREISSLLKKMGKSWTWFIDNAMTSLEMQSTDFLKKEAERHHEMYCTCIAELQKLENNAIQCIADISNMAKVYIDTSRNIEQPTAQDRFWIEQKLKKLSGWDIERFLSYCGECLEVQKV